MRKSASRSWKGCGRRCGPGATEVDDEHALDGDGRGVRSLRSAGRRQADGAAGPAVPPRWAVPAPALGLASPVLADGGVRHAAAAPGLCHAARDAGGGACRLSPSVVDRDRCGRVPARGAGHAGSPGRRAVPDRPPPALQHTRRRALAGGAARVAPVQRHPAPGRAARQRSRAGARAPGRLPVQPARRRGPGPLLVPPPGLARGAPAARDGGAGVRRQRRGDARLVRRVRREADRRRAGSQEASDRAGGQHDALVAHRVAGAAHPRIVRRGGAANRPGRGRGVRAGHGRGCRRGRQRIPARRDRAARGRG